MTDTTAEKIFGKLEALAGDLGEVKGDLKVIKSDIEHKPGRVEMIKEIESRAGGMIKSHAKGCPGSEHSGVYEVRNTPIEPIPTRQDTNTGSNSSIKISIPVRGKVLKYLIYALIMGASMAIGRLTVLDFDKDDVSPKIEELVK